MICLRCGYCCKMCMVVIVDDPEKGLKKDNLIAIDLHKDGPCKHLRGDKPGEYYCILHNKPWYKKTPCFKHGQIESSPQDSCRIGAYVLSKMSSENETTERNTNDNRKDKLQTTD